MLVNTRGIILRTLKYSETSLILDVFTEELGMRSYIISGVRSKKSKIGAGLLQVMSLVELVVYHREGKHLTRIKEIKASQVYGKIPFDIRRSAVGLFMAELIRQTIKESEENQKLFHFLYDSFVYLDQTNNPISNIHLCFMLGLSTFLGIMPGGEYDDTYTLFDLQEGVFVETPPDHVYFLTDQHTRLFSQLLEKEVYSSHECKLTRKQRQEMLQHLTDYFRLHIEHFKELNTNEILREVFGD